ncbi:hypothetical protein [Leuconostoc mesenteroides]|uniref:hypothetical protein n=1 Tax=Leuconostoc mesenteroides TaxID=1245 RepID=UPI002361F776|nr:hypothetical protein [Leuconostoc mesenteroides]
MMFDKWWKYSIFYSGIIIVILFILFNNTIKEVGSWADWFGAIGTISAVWLAISYRRTKINFDVDPVFRVVAIPMPGEPPINILIPQLEIDIFNINDPDLMIKNIEIVYHDTRLSALNKGPIIIKGFESKQINFLEPGDWKIDMPQYNILKENKAKMEITLFGDKKYWFDIRFINEKGA